jgi:adhesin HecA-like repeat protein
MTTPTPSKPSVQALRIRTSVRAGGLKANHGLRIRTSVRAGGLKANHGLRIRTTATAMQS